MSKEEEADATKELVQKITQKIFSNSSIDRDQVRSIISIVLRDYKIHKGVSEGKDIIIKQLEEEIRMLKQYQQIAINDKHHRKKRLNKALEEIKQLKTK